MTARKLSALVCAASVVTACSSSTVIRSNPSGAKVFVDNAYVGTTPYTLSDSKIAGSSTSVRLEYPGRQPTMVMASKSELKVGPLIAGIFLLVPLLWVTGYKGEYTVELAPDQPPPNPYATGAAHRAVELDQVDQTAH